MRKYFTSIIVVVGVALTASACGSDDEQTAPAATTDSAVQKRLDKLEEEARTARAEARRERARARRERQRARRARERAKAVAAAPEPSPEPAAVSSGDSGGITVPNVVGLDHQAAQDALQGEGLWLLEEEDCTGQGRLLLFDRNWEVQSTDPPAGTEVSEDTTITLCSVKQGE